jgi:hypothetical protein
LCALIEILTGYLPSVYVVPAWQNIFFLYVQAQNDPEIASSLYSFSLKKYESPARLHIPEELGKLPLFLLTPFID